MFTKKRDNVTKIATHAVLAIVVLTVSEFWSLRRIPKFGRVSVVSGSSDSCHSIWFLPRVPRRGLCYPLSQPSRSCPQRSPSCTEFSALCWCPEVPLSTWSYATCRQPLGWHPKACQGFATFLGWHPAATKVQPCCSPV